MNDDRQRATEGRSVHLGCGDHAVPSVPSRRSRAVRSNGTVAGLPAEDIVVLASGTAWLVPWELMRHGPFVSCVLLEDTVVRHITVPAMVASATRQLSVSETASRQWSVPETALTPSDYPSIPLLESTMSLLDAAALVAETGWELAVVMDHEQRVITARSVYRALIGVGGTRSAASEWLTRFGVDGVC